MSASVPDEIVRVFFERVGSGQLDDVRKVLGAAPAMVNVVGPHPFWGGRPQALHVAIEAGRQEMVDLLLEQGADVSGSNDGYDHWSPLMLAINRERDAMRDELLRRGARIGLLEALMLADDERVAQMLAGDELPAISPNGGSILAFARTPFAIDRLIALGASTDALDRWGASPIEAMSRLGRKGQSLVRHLISHGVKASPQEYARLGDFETLKRLVAADPSVAHLDAVMMGAVDFSRYNLVEWLLERGANVNARADAKSRHTALHSAAWNGDIRMVDLLIGAGADPAARDEQYQGTAFGWAKTALVITNNAKCQDIVDYLKLISPAEED